MKWRAVKVVTDFFKKMRINTRIIIFLVLFTAVPTFLVFSVSKFYTASSFNRYTNDFIAYTNDIIAETMISLFQDVNTVAFRFIQNRELYNILGDEMLTFDEKNQQFQSIVKNIIGTNSFIKNADIVDTSGNVYSYRAIGGFPDISPEYISKLEQSAQLIKGDMVSDENGGKYLMLGRNMRSFNTNFNLGSIILYLDENRIYETYKHSNTTDDFTAILDDKGEIISSSYKGVVGTCVKELVGSAGNNYITYNNKKFLLYSHPIQDKFGNIPQKMTIVNIVSQNNLWKMLDIRDIYFNILQIFILIMACFFIIYISKKIIAPITRLKNNMNLFGLGQEIESATADYLPRDEIKELEESFYHMVYQIKELMKKNDEEIQKQRESELKALQAQINPHFIYNALDSISFMAKAEKQKGIEDAVYALASFFRISLHKGDKFIMVQEEIDHVRSYLAIENIRSNNSYEVEFDVDEDILDVSILKIILQPLVENAIKHGLADKKEGVISIIGYQVQDNIHLEVIDNGCGFDVTLLSEQETTPKRSYGIKNVSQRIALEYGSAYGIKYYSNIGKGTRAEIILPIRGGNTNEE